MLLLLLLLLLVVVVVVVVVEMMGLKVERRLWFLIRGEDDCDADDHLY